MKNFSAISVPTHQEYEQRFLASIYFEDPNLQLELISKRKKRVRVRSRAKKSWKIQRGKGYLLFSNELKRRVRHTKTPWIYFKTEQWAKWLGRSRQTIENYLERFIRENSGYYCELTQVQGKKNAYFRRIIGHESKLKHDFYPLFITRSGQNRHLRRHLRRPSYIQKDQQGWTLPPSRNPFKQTGQCQIETPLVPLSISFSRNQQTNLNSFAKNKCSDYVHPDEITPKKPREGRCPPLPLPEFAAFKQKPTGKTQIPKQILRLAAFLRPQIEALHWDNCNIESNPISQLFYIAESLINGHHRKRIITAYNKALGECHAHALDSTSSDEMTMLKPNGFQLWKCTSTIFRAKSILNRDGLDREQRIKQLKAELKISNVTPGQN